MTTDVEIVAGTNRPLAQEGLVYMQSLVKTFNRFDPESELSCLHLKKESWVPVSLDLMNLLSLSKELELKSEGAFRLDYEGLSVLPEGDHGFDLDESNQCVYLHSDTQLNAGGIGKGFIVDAVVDFLVAKGAENILVNAGGDCRVYGEHSWKIGLFNPLDTSLSFGHVKVKKGAVTTSGIYARSQLEKGRSKTHFFDTKDATFIDSPPYASVTVMGELASDSEVYAKLILMGCKHTRPKAYRAIGVTYPDYKVVNV